MWLKNIAAVLFFLGQVPGMAPQFLILTGFMSLGFAVSHTVLARMVEGAFVRRILVCLLNSLSMRTTPPPDVVPVGGTNAQ